MFWKFKTKQRMVFRIIHVRDSLVPMQGGKLGLSWASIETMITDIYWKNSQVESYSCLLFKSGGERNTCENMQLVSSKVGMWVKVPSADVFFSSGRPTKVIGFQLFLTPNDKSLCFGSFVSWQRQWHDEGCDLQVVGLQCTKIVGPHALQHAISFVKFGTRLSWHFDHEGEIGGLVDSLVHSRTMIITILLVVPSSTLLLAFAEDPIYAKLFFVQMNDLFFPPSESCT